MEKVFQFVRAMTTKKKRNLGLKMLNLKIPKNFLNFGMISIDFGSANSVTI